jgi:hypothetical protein
MSPLSLTLLTMRCVTINYLSPKVKASLDRLIFCFESIRPRKCLILYLCIALRQNVNNCVPSSRLRQKNRTSGYLIPLVGNSVHVRVFLYQEVQSIIAAQLYINSLKKVTKIFFVLQPVNTAWVRCVSRRLGWVSSSAVRPVTTNCCSSCCPAGALRWMSSASWRARVCLSFTRGRG